MDGFIQKYRQDVTGTLSGWDRLRFRGTLRALAVTGGMMNYLCQLGVLLKDFGLFVERESARVKQACERTAHRLNRPIRYLPSSQTSKEDLAAGIARADGITEGLVCLLKTVEPCMSYEIHRDRQKHKLILQAGIRKCLHFYYYWMDRDFGLMHARLQTWFPLSITVCLNGRAWLARQMDRRGIDYVQADNCFLSLSDAPRAQRLMDRLLRWNWPGFLDRIAARVIPVLPEILRGYGVRYYWSACESEWASDVMFRSPTALAAIYPALARGAITAFDSSNVLRFLGKKPNGNFLGPVTSDYRRRPEGLRVKHAVGHNSVKMYDKQGSVLRVETTINDPEDLKVYRCLESDPGGEPAWRPMRKGVVDLRRRAEVSQGCNQRYYQALTTLDTSTALRELIEPICRPTRLGPCRLRAMRPWAAEDMNLLRTINRAEFTLKGFRNRDLVAAMHGPLSPPQKRRASARMGHRLRLLRGHHLVRKIPHTHRYQLTPSGRQIITAILQAQDLSLAKLAQAVA
jgi:hypothetical protein